MGKKGKDLERIRNLLFGEQLNDLKERLSQMENMLIGLEKMLGEQAVLLTRVETHAERDRERTDRILQKYDEDLRIGLLHQQNKAAEQKQELQRDVKQVRKNISEEMGMLKSEIIMMIEKRLNTIKEEKLSHEELSQLFDMLAKSLSQKDSSDTSSHRSS